MITPDIFSVKPRKPAPTQTKKLIVYTDDRVYCERTDTYHTSNELPGLITSEPPSIIVADGCQRLLLALHAKFHSTPGWQFQVRPIESKTYPGKRGKGRRVTDLCVNFAGFKGERIEDGPRGGKRYAPNRFHQFLDPVTFLGKTALQQITAGLPGYEEDEDQLAALFLWAYSLRDFCAQQQVKLTGTSGGIGAQLLRDKRFYPDNRRKVPAATNERGRTALPGNYYELYCDENKEYDAFYLDQVSSHHACASDITFPSSNRLRGHGHFRCPSSICRPIKKEQADKLLQRPGLFYLKLFAPHYPPGSFPLPCAPKHGIYYSYVFSNELPTLRELGVHIEGVIAAWVSSEIDTGLNEYARWAKNELTKRGPSKEWLKPVLLTTYGVLASRARISRRGYAHTTSGETNFYAAGAGFLEVSEISSQRELEPNVTNTIHRGMIEAETRLRSLAMARGLHRQNLDVLAVYADSVFVSQRVLNKHGEEVPAQLPLLPSTWRVQAALTRLQFHSPVTFTSNELSKTPGLPKHVAHAISAREPRARDLRSRRRPSGARAILVGASQPRLAEIPPRK